jgi:hypothetical protein
MRSESAGKSHDDFIGKLVGEPAHLRVGWRAAINFCNDRLRGRIAYIVKPGLDGDIAGGFSKIAEGDEVSVDW